MILYALAMLCALGATSFATVVAGRWYGVGVLALSFVLAVWRGTGETTNEVWVGWLVAFVAGVGILRPRTCLLPAATSGVLAGIWVGLLEVQGWPATPAVLLAGGVLFMAVFLTNWHPEFAPMALREEALLVMCGLGLLVAMAPQIVAGWGTAGALNLDPGSHVRMIVQTWVVVVTGASVSLGGWHALRRRR